MTFSFTGLPDLKKVVVIPYARSKHDADISKIPNRCVCVCVCLCLCIDMTTEQQTLFKKKNCVTHMQNLTTTLKNKNGIKITLLSDVYFRNPVTGRVGWFGGPDSACRPPVEHHCCKVLLFKTTKCMLKPGGPHM